MNHASLFSGIGGFDLAAECVGWRNVFNCEWEEFPKRVLKYHFPEAEQYDDIKQFDATDYLGRVDILSGGFPCQPFSVAGNRKGSEDERHLWPEMLRVIGECKPGWVVGENVRGLCNWSGGLVFETCCTDLETLGYSVQSFVIPACATGAPHRRDRVWIVAYSNDDGTGRTSRRDESESRSKGIQERNEVQQLNESDSLRGSNVPYTDSSRGKIEPISRQGQGKSIGRDSQTIRNRWEDFPTVPPVCGGNDGLPKELDGITFPKWRRESVKAYGNAIVPQVAYQIFTAIQSFENEFKGHSDKVNK